MSQDDDLRTTDEVATWLKVTPEALRIWRHRGEGPAYYKYGRQVVYRASDVEAWLETRRAGSQVPA